MELKVMVAKGWKEKLNGKRVFPSREYRKVWPGLATYRRIDETHRKVNYRTSNTANERWKPEETQLFYKRLIPWQVRRTSTNEKDGIQQERALKQHLLEDVLKDIAEFAFMWDVNSNEFFERIQKA
ncbi:hypothetical protein SELMODRAFT_421599 [Selaginella moellendorffii]|uniref:Uncharacterized protein n=1 Tax=Selaginella moellendorffii TaxID=88036 RepID=D8SFS2_SELML|nr:hypothetical protein SELMODRAFT_421599 [Selaginella moellendorffii]